MASPSEPTAEVCGNFRAIKVIQLRSALLFTNFFLVIMALYHLKPASRSLFIGSLGAEKLPYVWIATALTMFALIGHYHRSVARYKREHVVLGSCLIFSAILVVFRFLLTTASAVPSVCFYIFVDILGVVLVEQLWSLTNTIYSSKEGRSWYGFVGTGALLGGAIGGGASALLIKYTPIQTADLLLVAAGIILVVFAITYLMGRLGIYCEADSRFHLDPMTGGWRVLTGNRYLLLIAAILLLAQLASPFVEYQFMNTVHAAYPDQEARTALLSTFFGILGIVSIVINLVITPIIHRKLGVIAGLMVQPVTMSLCAFGFLFSPTLVMGSITKISDRGLSYSINRASKELLYVPFDPLLIYQAKAWIDMFGYRVFKIFGSVLILVFTQWLPFSLGLGQLSWFTLGICLTWIALALVLRNDYQLVISKSS